MNINDFHGFGFSAYRSIAEQTVKIGPLKKINFIIGQNNTGKSNLDLKPMMEKLRTFIASCN